MIKKSKLLLLTLFFSLGFNSCYYQQYNRSLSLFFDSSEGSVYFNSYEKLTPIIDMGPVVLGNTKSMDFVLTNRAWLDIEIQKIYVTGKDIKIHWEKPLEALDKKFILLGSEALAKDENEYFLSEEIYFSIEFTPSSKTFLNEKLIVYTDSMKAHTIEINLFGEGIASKSNLAKFAIRDGYAFTVKRGDSVYPDYFAQQKSQGLICEDIYGTNLLDKVQILIKEGFDSNSLDPYAGEIQFRYVVEGEVFALDALVKIID